VLTYHAKEIEEADAVIKTLEDFIFNMQMHRFLEELWKVLSIANKSIENHAPWVKVKEGKLDEANATVGLVANLLARVSVLLHAFMPKTTQTIASSLGFHIDATSYTKFVNEQGLLEDFIVEKTPPLFPRIEAVLMESPETQESKKEKNKASKKEESIITIDEFFNTKLKIGTILEAQNVEGSDRLLQLKVDVGEKRPREIIAGIRTSYEAVDLIDTQVCVVANLKPAKIFGLLSEGMLLAAKDKKGLSLIRPEAPKKVGTPVG